MVTTSEVWPAGTLMLPKVCEPCAPERFDTGTPFDSTMSPGGGGGGVPPPHEVGAVPTFTAAHAQPTESLTDWPRPRFVTACSIAVRTFAYFALDVRMLVCASYMIRIAVASPTPVTLNVVLLRG